MGSSMGSLFSSALLFHLKSTLKSQVYNQWPSPQHIVPLAQHCCITKDDAANSCHLQGTDYSNQMQTRWYYLWNQQPTSQHVNHSDCLT